MEAKKKLITIVDDSLVTLRACANVLEEKYAVATVPSAEKLFDLLEHNKPDLILLDIEMPNMNGYEAIKVLKENPETSDIPVIFLTGKSNPDYELEGLSLGAIDYITKPFQPLLLLKRIEIHLLLEEQRVTLAKQAEELKDFNENLQRMVDEKTQKVMVLQDALLKTVAELVECRDGITGSHIERTQNGVSILLQEIVKSGSYSEESSGWDNDQLIRSCLLHDVGKMSIGDHILKKPGALDSDEYEEMKKHTVFGAEIIEKIESIAKESDFLKYAKIFALSHHEKWDGSGYPGKLKENEISLLGRIMAIVDVYDALVSVRPYKKAYTHEEAVKIIVENSGTQFDPDLIEIFCRTAEQFKSNSSSCAVKA